ncbi:pyridoxamine 5'-phosphate oxidase family protein [Nonomuraea sp. NPDC050310]|uniref:pyridoxamine 5'-phosphate oxidase family protein n=1 Tax=Nonomuraea sp. NPDC050310 TaxID=3154935 RepID=UPI0033DFB183
MPNTGALDRFLAEHAAAPEPVLIDLSPEECLRLISPGGIGRVAFAGFDGPTVLPVTYVLHDGVVVFRTRAGGAMDHDLRTGMEGVDFKIAFEVDRIDETTHLGWSVLIRGPIHHLPDGERLSTVQPWAGGERDLYITIRPQTVTGRRIARRPV